ncbi:MAG: hypothetical protein E6I58_16850, partial [Chloroflexi bacterium]
RSVVGHFADPRVAFVQTPQNYRDWEDDQYLRGLYYSYLYFFVITMPARQHRNAIIFAGTMGLIRRKVLDEIGGWNADVVTEDAEASLRMLALGYVGVYEPRAFGAGLMPLSFDGLKKQRFRWALGGVQILRLHWRRLLLPAQGGRLTIGQRVHYLLGNVQWFGDPLMACFTVLLLFTAIADRCRARPSHRLSRHRTAAGGVGHEIEDALHVARRCCGPAGLVRAELGGQHGLRSWTAALSHRVPAHAEGARGGGHVVACAEVGADRSTARGRRCGCRDRDGHPGAVVRDRGDCLAAPVPGVDIRQRTLGEHCRRGHQAHAAARRLQVLAAEHRRPALPG